ncbi:hypothetical protein C8J57DRAFT_1232646 [Mycena rebaudengoi]|nr:hypothetical protein C8J57DRAFT_1232646 [Mycena rebaudengoi]
MPSKKKGHKDPNQKPELTATSGSRLIADSGSGKPPPLPPEGNATWVSLLSVDSGAACVDAESLGSIEPSRFLRPLIGGNFTFPHVVSPLAGILGSALDTDFTLLTPSMGRRAMVEEVEDEDNMSEESRCSRGSQSLLGRSTLQPSTTSVDEIPARVDDEDMRPKDWDVKARQQAQDALERDRAMRGQDAMARHLREMVGQAEKKLRDKQIDEDTVEKLRQKEISSAMKNLSQDKSDGRGAGERATHNFHDCVKLQRYRLQDIATQGYSNIPDQGIEWRDKVPYEVSPARTWGSSLASQQRYAEKHSETAKPIKHGISEAQKSAEKRVKEFYSSPPRWLTLL